MRKGFTLIELLAVIVILSIIALTAVPLITNVIERVRKASYEESLRNIFNVAELYIATNEFAAFPAEGIDISDLNVQMKGADFTSGKIIENTDGKLELEKVSNGTYCGWGLIEDIVVVEGSCDALDETAPTISISSNLVTSDSITIVAIAEDLESGINGYQFSKDDGLTWTNKQTSNVYTFTELTGATDYTFKVKVYNNNYLSTVSNSIVVTTSVNTTPQYQIDQEGWSQSAVVTIQYPDRTDGYTYEYSLDNGTTWIEVPSPDTSVDVTLDENGVIIARVMDGTTEVNSANYTVTIIDKTAPLVTNVESSVIDLDYNAFTIARTGDATDDISGLAPNSYIYQISSDGNNWTTKCTTSVNSCNVTGLNSDTTYYYRIGVVDNAGNENYISSKITNTLLYVNNPVLSGGMTPIKWNGSSWVSTTADDPEWYDYSNKKWANVKTADGSYWVWIPRYAYQISSGYHTSTTGNINIKFLVNTTDKDIDNISFVRVPTYSGSSQTNYIVHPSFTFGTQEIPGIWVAKFEPTAAEGVANINTPDTPYCDIAGDNVTTKTVKIIPNARSWRCINMSNAFTVSRNMESNSIYGWQASEVDTHMMKNMEWGSVAYLTQSVYGKNSQVWPNTNGEYITGCAGTGANATDSTVCNAYDSINGQQASTTGNVYGIYDMSGGAYEHTAAYIAEETTTYLQTYSSSLLNANAKYKDVYNRSSLVTQQDMYLANSNSYGDSIWETSPTGDGNTSWNSDCSEFPGEGGAVFARGGNWEYAAGSESGLFNFDGSYGMHFDMISFRPVVIPTN